MEALSRGFPLLKAVAGLILHIYATLCINMQDGTNRKALLYNGTYRKVHGALGALSAPFCLSLEKVDS